MRHGTSNRRQRNRGGSNNTARRGNQQRTMVYDSNGPDVRIRGTAHQVAEKYLALAKDSTSAGDRILAESYYQYAEHYIRIINEMNGTFDMSRVNQSMGEDDSDTVEFDMQKGGMQESASEDDLSLPASIIGNSVSSREVEIAE